MNKSKELWRSYIIYSNLLSLNSKSSSVSPRSLLCTKTTKDLELTCWKCHKSLSVKHLFCQYCSSIQKPDNQNYYDLFDLKLNYLVDKTNLSKKFKLLQSQLHPDKFSGKNQEERAISETFSAHLNKAYSILQNPLERGLYLLSLQDISIDEDSKGTDQKLLMEVLMLNEELDDAETKEELDDLHKKVRSTMDSLIEQINSSFEKEDFLQAKELLIKMKYFVTLDSKWKEKKNMLDLQATK